MPENKTLFDEIDEVKPDIKDKYDYINELDTKLINMINESVPAEYKKI